MNHNLDLLCDLVSENHSPIQWVLRVKRPGREADCSSPSSANVFMAWYLVKHMDDFNFLTENNYRN